MQWFKSKSNTDWIALRCSSRSTYIAQVQPKTDKKVAVKFIAIENYTLDDSKNIKQLSKKYSFNKAKVTYLLESKDYQLIQIDKPNVPDTELKEAARWQLKDLINFPVDEATVEVLKIPQEPQSHSNEAYLYAVASPNAHIGPLSHRLLNNNIPLEAIDVRSMAQRNIANLLSVDGQGEAMISFTENIALLTFTYQGDVYNARRIEIDGERNTASFEKIALEIQRSLDWLEAKFRHIFIKKLLVAPFDLRDKFCDYLRETIYTKVETFDLEDIFEFPPNSEITDLGQQACFLHVLGAALREEEPSNATN